MTEFELIDRYFRRAALGPAVRLGNGDDCALLAVSPGRVLATSTDMLVAGRHFFADVDPASLGWKTLAVNLSDLAAMGAQPLAFTLALALPDADPAWLDGFSAGLFECARAFDCELVGGDTTRGSLTLSVTVFGEVDADRALRRDAARPGDDLWVTGSLGGARLALEQEFGRRDGRDVDVSAALRRLLERPMPRVALGQRLGGLAHAAIDLSDGLAQDLAHVLAASRCGAVVDCGALPLHPALEPAVGREEALRLALAGGDDYELCFTAPPASRAAILASADATRTPVTRIGTIDDRDGLRLCDAAGGERPVVALRGFDHFA